MIQKIKNLFIVFTFLLPVQVLAATRDLKGLLELSAKYIEKLSTLLVLVALIVFMWGIVDMIRGNSKDNRLELSEKMIWGIVGLFVIISVWGLVSLIADSLQITVGGKFPEK